MMDGSTIRCFGNSNATSTCKKLRQTNSDSVGGDSEVSAVSAIVEDRRGDDHVRRRATAQRIRLYVHGVRNSLAGLMRSATVPIDRPRATRLLTTLFLLICAWWSLAAQEAALPSAPNSVKFAAIGD